MGVCVCERAVHLSLSRTCISEDMANGSQEQVEETAVSAVFVPPSIHHDDLILGASYAHYTPVPQLISPSAVCTSTESDDCTGTECVLGIDEAGRGPVLGPMVYGAFYLPTTLHHSLLAATHHFDDSKVLTPAVRARLVKAVCTEGSDLQQSCGWAIKSLSARDIGAGMLKDGASHNLNAQAMEATVELIKGVFQQGVNVREIYIDTIGNPEVYGKKLERIFPTVKIQVEKKADSLFPCVSAASVVAKVTRDVSCELLYKEVAGQVGEGTDATSGAAWGSGYPSDVRCVGWLKSEMDPLFCWGNECRFSWGTVQDMMELKSNGCTKVTWPAEQDDENMKMSDYFSTGPSGGSVQSEDEPLRTWFGSSIGQEAF